MGVGYAMMKVTTPTEGQLYNEMAPDLKRKVDAARAARQAREVAMEKQIDAQIASAQSPEATKPLRADPSLRK